MSINLSTFAPNTQAKSSEVNTNFTTLKTAVEESSYRAFPWGIIGALSVSDEQGMKWIVPQDRTVIKLWAKTDSGTATIRIQRDAINIHAGFNVTSTVGSTTTFNVTALTAGQVLTLDITAASGSGLWVVLETQADSVV